MKIVKFLFYTIVIVAAKAHAITPGNNWLDSYSAEGQCYCYTTFDHDAGSLVVDTPAGPRTTREICEAIGPGPGLGSNPIYNDLQCGNGPPNSAADEVLCPGRVDMGEAGCSIIGPTWNLEKFFPAPEPVVQPESTDSTSPDNTSQANESLTASSAPGSVTTEQTVASSVTPNVLAVVASDIILQAGDYSSKDDRWLVIDDTWINAQAGGSAGITSHIVGSTDSHYMKVFPTDDVWAIAGEGPQIHFDIGFDEPGDYEVYVRMYSTSALDDAVSVGVDGIWPQTGNVLHTCGIHDVWTWSACGGQAAPVLNITNGGVHSVQLAAMESGVELDQIVFRRLADDTSIPEISQAVAVGSGVGFSAGGIGFFTLPIMLLLYFYRRNGAKLVVRTVSIE